MNIRYFFVTDQVGKENLEIEYCPTEDMIGVFMTKPLRLTRVFSGSTRMSGSRLECTYLVEPV